MSKEPTGADIVEGNTGEIVDQRERRAEDRERVLDAREAHIEAREASRAERLEAARGIHADADKRDKQADDRDRKARKRDMNPSAKARLDQDDDQHGVARHTETPPAKTVETRRTTESPQQWIEPISLRTTTPVTTPETRMPQGAELGRGGSFLGSAVVEGVNLLNITVASSSAIWVVAQRGSFPRGVSLFQRLGLFVGQDGTVDG